MAATFTQYIMDDMDDIDPNDTKIPKTVPDPNHKTNDALNVEVRASNIGADAGMGLFALKKFKKGDYICQYSGRIMDTKEVSSPEYKSHYIWQYNKKYSIDAQNEDSCFGRYANDNFSKTMDNADIRKYSKYVCAKIVASETIEIGDEIYVPYGGGYWSYHEYIEMLSSAAQTKVRRRYPLVDRFVRANYHYV
jgi:hypothetical protein